MHPDFLGPELDEPAPATPPSRTRRVLLGVIAAMLVAAMALAAWPAGGGPVSPTPVAAADPGTVTMLAGTPSSIDPARHGDLTSARFVSQLYETLTAVGASLEIQPALAESWVVEDGGRRVTFTLRPGLTFSDGTPLGASDVVRSWRRLFDARDPSPLASLIADVVGARDLLSGASNDPSTLGVRAEGDRTVVVDLERGGGDLAAIVSSAPFAVVPPSADEGEIVPDPGKMVVSGGYTLARVDPDAFELKANPAYWAGKPAIETVRMVTTIGGRNPVDEFSAGNLDLTQISSYDAGWVAYDRQLGPALRSDPSLSVIYYGFDARNPPFDDARVRRAFAQAVDWRRLAALDEPGTSVPATGMVPAGMPGAPEGDFLPPYDPAGARTLLAEAGYPGGAGLGPVSFVSSGGGLYDGAIKAMLEENLGVAIDYATMSFGDYQERLSTDPPGIWNTDWVADYPGPNDFLGVLLGSGSTSNEGGWFNPAFDAAVNDATSAANRSDALAAYERAMGIVRDQVPVVPVSYGTSYRLVRDRLRGAVDNGQGIIRLAGLSWGDGQ